MKKVLLLTAAIMFTFSAVGFSQETKKGPYQTNRWYDNIFGGIGVGVNLNVNGDHSPHGGIGNGTIAPAFDINLGKWFTPNVGTRLAVNGFNCNGWAWAQDLYGKGDYDSDGYATEKVWFQNYRADFLYNLTNAIQGYRSDRLWDVIPFLGFGAANSHAQEHHCWAFTATAGILNNIRITDALDITLEGKYMIAQDEFDGAMSADRHRVDGLASLTIGVAYNFGVNTFKRAETPNYGPYEDQISGLKNDLASVKSALANQEKKNNELASALANEKNKPASEPVVITKMAPTSFFFNIDKAALSDEELANFDAYMNNALSIDPNKKFTITGTCDSATGSKAYNQKLSAKRADYISNLMVKKYGVNPDNITKVYRGADQDDYKKARLNRRVLVVE